MRVVFAGSGEIALPSLESLLRSSHELLGVVTQPDKPAGRKLELRPSQVKLLARQHELPIFQPARLRDRAAIEQITSLEPDLIVIMSYGQIVPREILIAPRVACINLHASLLPRHRGAAPIHAAIESGDRESGITVMFVDEGLDTGDILLKRKIPIRRRETAGTLHDRLARLAPSALADAIDLLEKGNAPRIPQDPALATYAKKITRENARIDWNAPALEIERKVRAMNPWPGAFALLPEGPRRTLKIFSAIVCRKRSARPGEIVGADRDGILVGSGCGALLLRDVQLEGKKQMSAGEFLRGHPIPVGEGACFKMQ